jgi:hypothetical protein
LANAGAALASAPARKKTLILLSDLQNAAASVIFFVDL